MNSLPRDILDIAAPMELQDVIPLLDVPETTLHRWIDALRIDKHLTREGSRTVCRLSPDNIRRLYAHKVGRDRRSVAAKGVTNERMEAKPGPGSAPADERNPQGPLDDSISPAHEPPPVPANILVATALQDALARADALQAQIDALRMASCISDPYGPRPPDTPPDKEAQKPDSVYRFIVVAIVAVARIAGVIMYRTYWVVVRVLLPREISRALLNLKRSDYIGWEGEASPPAGVLRRRRA